MYWGENGEYYVRADSGAYGTNQNAVNNIVTLKYMLLYIYIYIEIFAVV